MRRLEVRYFAAASDAAGRDLETIELPREADLGVLRDELVARYGDRMQQVLAVAAFLVESSGASPQGGMLTRDLGHPIGRRVDVLPPFAGG